VVTKLVFGFGMFAGVSCFPGEVCGCVPGLLRTGSPVVPLWFSQKQLSHSSYKNDLRKPFEMDPCMSECVCKMNL
jgi:hypothetical protein